MALRTPTSNVFVPVMSSNLHVSLYPMALCDANVYIPEINGSIRGASVIRVPRAFAALDRRSSLAASARDLAKVRWSCGRNGLRKSGIFSNRLLSASKIAPASYQ